MAKQSSAASNDAPDSFVKLHHWCETWSSRYQCPDGKRATRLFEKEFRAELDRLGESDVAEAFPKPEGGWEKSRGLRDTIQLGMAASYRLAVKSDELPDGWEDCCRSGITVPLPAQPLRTAADLEQWIREWLNWSKLTDTAELHPARALMLWTIFRQARLWFASHGMADGMPITPTECDSASKWIRHGQTEGHTPSQRDAERGLAKLLAALMAWKKRNEPSSQKHGSPTAADDSLARIVAGVVALLQKPKRTKRDSTRPAHRPPDTDHKQDALWGDRWLKGWHSREFQKYADLSAILRVDESVVRAALGRDRKRPLRKEEWAKMKRISRRKKPVKCV